MAKDEEYRALVNRRAGIVEVSGPDQNWVDDTLDHLLGQLGGAEAEPTMPEPEDEEEEEQKPKPRGRGRARQTKS